MAGSLHNLNQKYQNRVQRHLESDLYYQYLLELIASGKTTVSQFNRVLDKTIDEKWLEAIEAAIPAIHEVIAHPRRFLKVVEDLAPVEKVKKIGPNTVQHLASHTQFISGMRGGTIYPGKLLTVENEESLDLYENRFVSTLIRKVSEFIEKRTGALFWDTGDEQSSLLRMEATVEDDYEIIEYKLDMTVKSKQTYLENDTDKIDLFKRIDRVRRVVADFRQSAFVAAMSDTAAVRPPIQRTNQIIKHPDYRKCYDLWQFLERYDQVGYEVDVRETALDFDEDYLFQMYGNLALNYAVFKSLLTRDQRRITENPKRRKAVKPKFIKQIIEEFVDNYDLPDVEIRQVIIEEVTKAQAEIERRTAERRKAAPAKEQALNKARLAKEKEKEQARLLREKAKEKERLAKEREKAKEKARIAKEKEKEKAQLLREKEKEKERLAKVREKAKEKARIAKAKEQEKARIAAEKAKEKERLAKEQEKAKEKERLAQEKARAKAAAIPKAKAAPKASPKPKAAEPIAPPVVLPEPMPEPELLPVAETPEPMPEPTPEPAAIPEPTPEAVVQKPTPGLLEWIQRRRNRNKPNS